MERVINRNKWLYGPGPLARRPTGWGAMPPKQGLVMCALAGGAFSLVGGFAYLVIWGNPGIKRIEEYYKENPSR